MDSGCEKTKCGYDAVTTAAFPAKNRVPCGKFHLKESVEVDGRSRNLWRGRVLLATNRVEDVGKTVPVLTMESLAYIPPPLVNEARYWSRKTPTAAWQSIPYDVGRYAYCAIDVSDYFDVNRLTASYPRSSAANRRIT